jgi:type I restriction enzyme S subunit
MELMPGYKKTDIGLLPEEWNAVPLYAIGWFKNGINKGSESFGHGSPFVNLMDVFGVNKIDSDEGLGLVETTDSEQKTYGLKLGDVLFIRSSVKPSGVGLTAVIEKDITNSVYSGFLLRFRDEGVLDTSFKRYCFYSEIFRRNLINASSVSANTNINQDNLKKLLLALPPTKKEQHAIATALSDIDALLDSLDRLIAKKRNLKQAAMQQLLTGQTRLPGFSGAWEVKAIHQIANVGRGRVISHKEISKANNLAYPVFSSQTFNDGIMGYLDTYDFEGDYVTWTTDGANAGTVFARSGRFNCTNVCGTIKLQNSNHSFIAAALGAVTQPHVSRHLGNPKLMNDVMKKIEIKLPTTLAEQSAIADVLSQVDIEINALVQRKEKTVALKQGMMQELLTGRTRLL